MVFNLHYQLCDRTKFPLDSKPSSLMHLWSKINYSGRCWLFYLSFLRNILWNCKDLKKNLYADEILSGFIPLFNFCFPHFVTSTLWKLDLYVIQYQIPCKQQCTYIKKLYEYDWQQKSWPLKAISLSSNIQWKLRS